MSNKLSELRETLRRTKRHWEYATHVRGKDLTDSEKEEIAQKVFDSPIPWARGLAEEFAARQYPPGYDEDDD